MSERSTGKDLGELFDMWMDENPFDGSEPMEHFQTEVEYLDAFTNYINHREKAAFFAGFTCGKGHERKFNSKN